MLGFKEKPYKVFSTAVFTGDDKEHGVPNRLNAMLYFKDNKIAKFECSFDAKFEQWFEITGTAASLWCWDFCQPYLSLEATNTTSKYLAGYEVRKQLTITPFTMESRHELNMIKEMERIIKSGVLENRWFEETLMNQEIIDAILESAMTEKMVILTK